MPRPEVTAHPATAKRKAGGPRRADAEQSRQRSLVAHAAPGGHGPPSDGKAQGRWSAASRRGTKSAGHSLLMPRPEVASHPRRRARSSFKTSPSSPQLPNRQRPTRMSHKFEKRCEARQSEIREGSVLAYVIERIAVITPPRALVVLRFLLNDSQKTACFLAEFHNSLLSNRLKLFSRNR